MKKIFISALLLGAFVVPSLTFAEVSEERRAEIANMGVVGAVNRLQDEGEFPEAAELAFKEITEGHELDEALDDAIQISEHEIEHERHAELESRVDVPSRYAPGEAERVFDELSDEINGRNVASADYFESDDDEE